MNLFGRPVCSVCKKPVDKFNREYDNYYHPDGYLVAIRFIGQVKCHGITQEWSFELTNLTPDSYETYPDFVPYQKEIT